LEKAKINYSVTEKECLAVVWSTEWFVTMLLGHQFTLHTDHSALRNLLTNKVAQGRLAWWSIKLQEFDMEVQHRKGMDHINADFLSRLEQMTDGTYQMEMEATQAEDGRISRASQTLLLPRDTYTSTIDCEVNPSLIMNLS